MPEADAGPKEALEPHKHRIAAQLHSGTTDDGGVAVAANRSARHSPLISPLHQGERAGEPRAAQARQLTFRWRRLCGHPRQRRRPQHRPSPLLHVHTQACTSSEALPVSLSPLSLSHSQPAAPRHREAH